MALTPPNKIVIDFLEGVDNRTDAVAYARGFINSHFDVPEQSGYYVMPCKGGYAFEVHEGGSRRAYLPAILRTIEESPTATVSVRSGSRVLQVSKGARDNFNSVLLPEELSSYLENVIEPDPKAPALIPYQIDNVIWLFWGMVMLGLGTLVLIFSLGFFLLEPSQEKPIQSNSTPPGDLPIAQWQNMIKQLNGDNFISQMKYEGGQWSFVTVANDAVKEESIDENKPAGVIVMTPDGMPKSSGVDMPTETKLPSAQPGAVLPPPTPPPGVTQ